jgi:hypothetical protein
MKPLLDGLRSVTLTPFCFLLSVLGPLIWATTCVFGVAVIISVFALPIYLIFQLVCEVCSQCR